MSERVTRTSEADPYRARVLNDFNRLGIKAGSSDVPSDVVERIVDIMRGRALPAPELADQTSEALDSQQSALAPEISVEE